MGKLKPLRKDEELAAVPLDEPVLVELEPAVQGSEPDEIEEPEPKPQRRAKDADEDDGADPGVKKIKEQLRASTEALERSEAARVAAENEARQRAQEVEDTKAQHATTERELVTNSLASAQAEVASAKADYKAAYEAGDPVGMADAHEKIGLAAARVVRLQETVASFDDEDKRQKSEAERAPTKRDPVDPAAAIDANPNLLPAERAWLKQHLELMVDPIQNRELEVSYHRAMKAGLTRGTPKYFQFIEDFMGIGKGGEQIEDEREEPPVSAPVSRGGGVSLTGRRASESKVHLDPVERAFAADLREFGVTETDFARGKQKMELEKRANPEKFAQR